MTTPEKTRIKKPFDIAPDEQKKPGHWYPLGLHYANHDEVTEWGVFRLDPSIKPGDRMYGDVVPVFTESYTYSQAEEIARAHNDTLEG